mgnify:CR=1 FL=1
MAKKKKSAHYSGIGGQAVLEGVMMKNKDDYAVAIRKADGEIDVEVDVFRGLFPESRITKIPFLRGIFNFIDSLRLGMKCINHSAQFPKVCFCSSALISHNLLNAFCIF